MKIKKGAKFLSFYFMDYCNSTTAPASSNLAFIASASSLATPSLIALGAPSTISLASFNPKPVNSLTALITLIFSLASFKITLNSVFSSAAAPPATAPATATGAAAETPNSSSQALTNSFNSQTLMFFIASII